MLMSSPPEIRLTFSEEVLPGLSSLILVQTDGNEVNLRGANDSHDIHVLTASLPTLPPGGYFVKWKVTAADGHPASGSYSFVVAAPAAMSSTPVMAVHMPGHMAVGDEMAFPIVASILRGIGLSALLALTGMLGFLRRADGDRGPVVRPIIQAVGAVAAIALFLHLFFWMRYVDAPSWRATLNSGPGRLEQARFLFSLLLLISVLSASKRSLSLVFGAAAILVSGMIGHPASVRPLLSIPLVVVHLGAASVWIGGVLWLAMQRSEPPVRIAIEAARVSSAALIASIVVTVTGVIEALILLPTLSDLFTTTYGGLIIGKLVGLTVLIGFGWYHRFRGLPRFAGDSTFDMTPVLRYEITVMVVVVMIAGFLAHTPLPQ
ncbi:MAG: copper resistance protein CopC/CopD [Gemmatimonadaceae bacterium]|nr:copper resistance protein CopC/CopD [Gemmatimonadaceae bacterium]